MPTKKPAPLHIGPARKHCPVCGEVSYSSAGVHPQCSVELADTRRMAKAKKPDKSRKPVDKSPEIKAWHKQCPSCSAQIHIRRTTCDCGHTFRRTAAGREWD